MAAVIYLRYRNRRAIRRNRIFRDRKHPLEIYNDEQIYTKFRFYRHLILQLTDEVRNEIEFVLSRKGSLTPILQVLLTLRFYATGTLQNVIGDLLCVDQSTVSRIVNRVTNAFLRRMNQFIVWPDQRKADANKRAYYRMRRFPGPCIYRFFLFRFQICARKTNSFFVFKSEVRKTKNEFVIRFCI